MPKDIDTILDEMGAEIRTLQESIMAQNILQDGYKRHIKDMEKQNTALKSRLKGLCHEQ